MLSVTPRGWPGPLHSLVAGWDVCEAFQLLKKRHPRQKSRRGWEKGLKFKCSLVSETFTVPVEMETGKEGATCSMNNQTHALLLL